MTNPPAIAPAVARFLEGPVSIVLAACGNGLVVDVAQALAARVADGDVSILVARSQAEDVLGLVAQTGRVAVTFSLPSSHRTLQIKGRDARVEATTSADLAGWRRYRNAFADELASIGFGGAYAEAMLTVDERDLVAVRFSPTAVFVQTPGPDAGRRLPADAGEGEEGG